MATIERRKKKSKPVFLTFRLFVRARLFVMETISINCIHRSCGCCCCYWWRCVACIDIRIVRLGSWLTSASTTNNNIKLLLLLWLLLIYYIIHTDTERYTILMYIFNGKELRYKNHSLTHTDVCAMCLCVCICEPRANDTKEEESNTMVALPYRPNLPTYVPIGNTICIYFIYVQSYEYTSLTSFVNFGWGRFMFEYMYHSVYIYCRR